MKKLLGALAVSAALTGTTFASPFTDVPSSHWAYGAINDVVASGIMKGYRGGMFKGNETVNRYEMAIIVSRLMKKAGGKGVGADVRRTMDRLGEEFMDELDLIGARLTALENAFHEHVTEGGDTGANGFAFSGETRVRWENRTEELAAAVPATKDDNSRFQVRTLLDVEKSVDRADFFIQLEHGKTFGDTFRDTENQDVNLNQAWVNLAVTDNSSLKIGRQAIEIGNGSIFSRHDYLQSPNSFDGWVFSSSYDDISYNVWSLRLDVDTNFDDIDTDVHGLDVNFTDVFEGDLHVHYYHATGASALTRDNLGVRQDTANLGDTLDTYGFAWSRDYEEWDFHVQYAAQSGDNGAANPMDYDGELVNLAVGYDVDEDDKLGLSWTSFSGDDVVANDTSNKAWVDIAGDGHKFLGFADVFAMSNIEDLTFTWDRQVNDRNSFHLAYHMFSLESSRDEANLIGNGLGAWGGVAAAGTPSNGAPAAGNTSVYDDDLGTELDLVWNHKLSNDVSVALGYALFDAGDYFTANNAAGVSPDVDYAWVTASVKF